MFLYNFKCRTRGALGVFHFTITILATSSSVAWAEFEKTYSPYWEPGEVTRTEIAE